MSATSTQQQGAQQRHPALPGVSGHPHTTGHYLGAGGKEVNTATPGGHIGANE